MTDAAKIALLRACLVRIVEDLEDELSMGGRMPTLFPEEIRLLLESTA